MRGSLRTTRGDVGVVVVFAVGALVEVAVRDGWRGALLPDALGAVTLQLFLLVRRTRPLLAIAGYTGLAVLGTVLQTWLRQSGADSSFIPIVALLVLTYSLGAHGSRRDLLLGCPLPLLVVVVVDVTDPSQGSLAAALPFFATFVVAVPVLAGRAVRSRRQLVARLREQEQALAGAHARALDEARIHEEMELHDRLDRVLGTGLAELLDHARQAREGSGDLAALETDARALLAQTRESVVSLSRPPEPEPVVGPAATPPRLGEAAQPWAVVIAAAIGVGALLELDTGGRAFPWGLLLTASMVAGIALAWRHPVPATVVAWAAAAALARIVTPYDASLTGIGIVVGTAFLVAWVAGRDLALLGLAVCGAGALAAMGTADLLGRVTFLLLAWGAGRLLRDHTLLLRRVQDTHSHREAARAAEVRATVLEQRAAAARELHDALGHSLTVVALQAGAARRVREQDPEAALAALAVIEEVTRSGLAELRGGLRASWDPAALVAVGRDAGHQVTVDGVEPPPEVAPVCQRVVQEAVTNVLRHAPGAPVQVRIARSSSGLQVSVTNGRPTGAAPTTVGGGHGLAGMRERVGAQGGSCAWGPTPEGGFVVRVELPLPGVREPA